MASHRIRLGIIGTGIAARDLHLPALAKMPDLFEVVAICNHHLDKAHAFAQLLDSKPVVTDDYHALLAMSDVEAVDLTLPIALNARLTTEALRAGKHTIVEKPVAATADAGRAVVAEGSTHPDLVLLVAENVRYERRFRVARELLDRGKIGRVVMIHADVLQPVDSSNPYAQTAWRQKPEHLGGFLSDGGVHQTAAMHVLGGPVVAVQGLITSFGGSDDGPDTYLMNLQYASGAMGHLTYSVGVFAEEPAPFKVFGTEGTLVVHPEHIHVVTNDGAEVVPVPSEPNGFELEFRDFYRAIVEGKPLDVTPQQELDDFLLVDAAFRSFREGITIAL